MPEWLVVYLAFSLAGGVTTYLTVLKEADKIYMEATEDKSKLGIGSFVLWNIASVLIAPLLAYLVLKNKTGELATDVGIKWVENARYND